MTILGIETSCDETSAAVIRAEGSELKLLANVISSSLEMHSRTGGIIPEQAAREQVKFMLPVITQALEKAEIQIEDIDAIAVTYGPGLIGSLLVGVETAKTLSFVLNKPLIPVNHMIGHIYANFITPQSGDAPKIAFPAIALVVSGGHTDLLLLEDHGKYKLLGGTRDDAAGECFDKCARLLGYPYPGGPKISQLADKGDPSAIPFPRPMIGSDDYAFSFSGLKTAFLNTTKKHFSILRNNLPDSNAGWQQVVLENNVSENEKQTIYDLCAGLQKAIVSVLVRKTIKAAQQYNVQSVLVSGGVSANASLRETFEKETKEKLPNAQLFFPPRFLSTDNAAMIAAAAFYDQKKVAWKDVTADPELYF